MLLRLLLLLIFSQLGRKANSYLLIFVNSLVGKISLLMIFVFCCCLGEHPWRYSHGVYFNKEGFSSGLVQWF